MIKAIKPVKKIAITTLASFLLGLVIAVITIGPYGTDFKNMELAFLIAREQSLPPDHFNPLIITLLMPLLIMTVVLAGTFADHFEIVKNYVFIRVKTIRRWYFENLSFLFTSCLTSSIAYHVGILTLCICLGYRTHNLKMLFVFVLYCTAVYCLILFIISLPANVMALKIGLKNSVLLCVFVEGLSIVSIYLLPNKLIKYVWMSHYFFQWHKPDSPALLYLNKPTIAEMGLDHGFLYSILFLTLMILAEQFLAYRILRRNDYL